MIQFGDFSHWNNDRAGGALDYKGYAKNHEIAVIKGINGTSVDPYFRGNRSGFHSASIKRLGIYAYATTGSSAIQQARAFIELVGKLLPNEFPILDLEDDDIPLATYNDFATQWDVTIKSFYRVARTTLYTGDYKVGYITHPMNRWVARYSNNPPQHPYDAWQFTSTASLAGMGAPNDYTNFNGTLELFDQIFLPWIQTVSEDGIDMAITENDIAQIVDARIKAMGVLTKNDLDSIGDSIITNLGNRAYNTQTGKGKAEDQIQRFRDFLTDTVKKAVGK